MATKSSGEIAAGTSYELGDYTFRTALSYDSQTGKTSVYAYCRVTEEGVAKAAYKTIELDGDSNIQNWSVEANDTTADVYATVLVPKPGGSEKYSDLVPYIIPTGGYAYRYTGSVAGVKYVRWNYYSADVPIAAWNQSSSGSEYVEASSVQQTVPVTTHSITEYADGRVVEGTTQTNRNLNRTYTHNGKTVYYQSHGSTSRFKPTIDFVEGGKNISLNVAKTAWTMVYGNTVPVEYETKSVLIGRFSIDIEEAGGAGDDSDWDDPIDDGEPNTTLHLEVTGALSGRHNDPLNQFAGYSYIPANNETVKGYGDGGDGGYGGGGGAGASTVVIKKFATNRASGKDLTAIARRHGYGSGGGKGGKGGDGCLLIYY